ncbi:hypothetical protein EW026_g6753 [Hermanssonia centrifuga]|uniref:BZIP domain-containing protein n=1 Tax=Hermanssonia centrifuga TaxID=98765 RepID=A0A4S4KA16_9APHY|nr:hypothetical protein EW026_g6753 [Hermanssonia centrifuga]
MLIDSVGRNPSSGPHRRKSSGNPQQDETRLLKRKEQNRAAQRAFRERKEKHVKDLEDKVAALEAKHQLAESENDNLRDLLSRLQSENMALKQAAFTFTVPKPNGAPSNSFPQQQSNGFFSTPGASTSSAASSVGSPAHMSMPQQHQQPQPFDFNFGSLIPFDPASLNMIDEPTATDGAMNMDFGFGQPNGLSPYKTIASNPMYMSFAEPMPYDLSPPPIHPLMQQSPTSLESQQSTPIEQLRMTPFDWNSNSPPTSGTNGMDSLDQLFSVGYNGAQSPVDFSALLRSPPSSPNGFAQHPPGQSTDGCPRTKEDVSKMIQQLGTSTFVQNPLESPRQQQQQQNGAFFQNQHQVQNGDGHIDACPKFTKESLLATISRQAPDETVGPNGGFVRKMSDGNGSVVMCKGSSFPKTEKSERNIEVLAAWRSITSNPQFKNVDINELCSEFTKKARCDGTKVVLEPEGVSDIIESLSVNKRQ